MRQLELFPGARMRLPMRMDFFSVDRRNFFDRAAVRNRLDPELYEALRKVGMDVRQEAKRSIRPRRQKRINELTDAERVQFEASKSEHQAKYGRGAEPDVIYVTRRGRATAVKWADTTKAERKRWHITASYARKRRVRRPYASSQPGQAPRSITGLLRKKIFYSLDNDRESTVIGPEWIAGKSGDAPYDLEHGGIAELTYGPNTGQRVHIAPRPYMQPALDKVTPRMPAVFSNLI